MYVYTEPKHFLASHYDLLHLQCTLYVDITTHTCIYMYTKQLAFLSHVGFEPTALNSLDNYRLCMSVRTLNSHVHVHMKLASLIVYARDHILAYMYLQCIMMIHVHVQDDHCVVKL